MPAFDIKKVQLPAEAGDGFRVLVDRLWPRGVSKEHAALDEWQKDLAPSVALRKWFDHDPARFEESSGLYVDELKESAIVDAFLEASKGRQTTLLYAAHDPAFNHAVVLARYLNRHARR